VKYRRQAGANLEWSRGTISIIPHHGVTLGSGRWDHVGDASGADEELKLRRHRVV